LQRSQQAPHLQQPISPADADQLQRAIGNQAVGQLAARKGQPDPGEAKNLAETSLQHILDNKTRVAESAMSGSRPVVQAKLTLGPVGDQYEQEADQVAKHVVGRLSAGEGSGDQAGAQSAQRQEEELQAKSIANIQRQEEEELQMKPADSLQRQEEEEELAQMKPISTLQRQEEEELQAKPISDIQRQEDEELQAKPLPLLQRQEEEEEMVQSKSITDGGPVTADVENAIQGARAGGQPLADTVRAPMENAFDADFSGVKVHTDNQSNALNQSLQARAFTTGQDIFFRQGEYDPGSSAGQELLAHELTHVVQQGAAPVQRHDQETDE